MHYKVHTGEQIIEVSVEDLQKLDLVKTGKSRFHLLHENQSYTVQVLQTSSSGKSLTIEINGNTYNLSIEDAYDQLVEKMGLSIGGTQKLKNIKAPMPGLILDILVKPGQTIEKGDQLLILEAMKMENVLKSEGEGIVKSVEVNQGATVDKGQILIEMED